MRKKIVFLSLVSTLTLAAGVAVAFQTRASSYSVKGTSGTYYHYEAVEADCSHYGIKEYWTNCKGDTTISEPTGVSIVEMGQPTQDEILAIIDAYGVSDERIIDKNDHHDPVTDADCLGRLVCSDCHQVVGSEVPTIDFVNNGIYGMYDWYLSFGTPDPSWVSVVDAGTIQFLTYNPGVLSEIKLPRIYYAGFDRVSIDLAITYKDVKISFDKAQTNMFTVPSNGYATKIVFSNISADKMNVSIIDSSSNVLISTVVSDADVLAGKEGFKIYAEGVYTGVGYERLSNFSFIKDCVHNYVADANCIGKEVCSICGHEHGIEDPTFDFTSNLYNSGTVYEPWGDFYQDGWARADNAGQVSFVCYEAGAISRYYLPKIYFAAYSRVTIDIAGNYEGTVYGLDHDFSSSWTLPFSNYDSFHLYFENITATSMTVIIADAFGTTQVSATCTNLNVLNGLENFQLFVKGMGAVGWDTCKNFTFVA